MESARTSDLLHREVMTPQRTEHGLGVLLVSSVAMFFAVLSSAFIMQTRTSRTCPATSSSALSAGAASVPVDARALELYENANTPRGLSRSVEIELSERAAAECGRPIYRENPDGSVSVFFEVCPSAMVYRSEAQDVVMYDVGTGEKVTRRVEAGYAIDRTRR